jgi:creatinine amidohydrolase
VHYIGDLYYKSFSQVRAYLREHGLPPGHHASVEDTSELMFVDREGRWIRKDRLSDGSPASGVEGDPRLASAEAGRVFIDFKVDAAVAQIRRLSAQRP